MLTWWMASNRSITTMAARASVRSQEVSVRDGPKDADEPPLGVMLLNSNLHQRFPYIRFGGLGDTHNAKPMQVAQACERLQEKFSSNAESLRALRDRLGSLEKRGKEWSFSCRWDDVRRAFAEVGTVLRHPFRMEGGGRTSRCEDGVDATHNWVERRLKICLAVSAATSAFACVSATLGMGLPWSVCAADFSIANGVLLLCFSRLSLPHTHRQFERQVSALADQRKEILADIESIQVDSMGAGMTHVRACILMQSVNVVRNINYFVMCVKTESQRAAMSAGGAESASSRRQQITTCGVLGEQSC